MSSRSSYLSSIPYSAGLYSTDSYRQLNAHLCPTLLSAATPVLALSLPVVKLVASPERICQINGQIVHTEVDPTQRAAPCVVVAYSACQTPFAPYRRYEDATRRTSCVVLRGFVLVVERCGTMVVHDVRRSHTRLQHLLAVFQLAYSDKLQRLCYGRSEPHTSFINNSIVYSFPTLSSALTAVTEVNVTSRHGIPLISNKDVEKSISLYTHIT
ncbi:MAG: hypothetical protein J07HQX50_02616 [Haloquadratum sp. J07HQX50]|nr:MAG: hypothetical protein J07HQX50_02616 [Haloquadratum sp. J07HQX50]